MTEQEITTVLNGHKIQWNEVFINNGYGIEYMFLRVINSL